MEIKREVESDDMTECPHNDETTTGILLLLILQGVPKFPPSMLITPQLFKKIIS